MTLLEEAFTKVVGQIFAEDISGIKYTLEILSSSFDSFGDYGESRATYKKIGDPKFQQALALISEFQQTHAGHDAEILKLIEKYFLERKYDDLYSSYALKLMVAMIHDPRFSPWHSELTEKVKANFADKDVQSAMAEFAPAAAPASPRSILQSLNYKVNREGSLIHLTENSHIVATIFVDATDNRLTIKSIKPNIPLQGIKVLTDYLDENFGAKQVFVIPEELKSSFIACGFKTNPLENPFSERLRETSFERLLHIQRNQEDRIAVIGKEALLQIDSGNLEELAATSGFLASKREQYKLQGPEGFRLMFEYSEPIALQDKETKRVVGVCRVTPLNEGNFYLGDTFVDEKYFGSKATGTAILYNEAAKKFNEGRVFVIAPPGRVEEFQNDYGCVVPTTIMTKFTKAGPELEKVFSEEKERILAAEVKVSAEPMRPK